MRKQVLALLMGMLSLATSPCLFGQIFFGITPIRAEHAGKPGENITDIFQIRNSSSRPIRIRVFAENWTMQPDGTPSFIGAQPTSFSCKDWIKVNPRDFRLMPNEIKAVRYTITVPRDSAAAGYHAALSFETVPDTYTPRSVSGMVFTGKIAAAVYVKIGQVPIEGDAVDIKIGRKDSSQTLILVMKNTGKTHYRTKGGIEIFDSGNNKVMALEVPDEVVLPESERDVVCALSKTLEPGLYRVVCRLDIGRPEIIGLEKSIEVIEVGK